MRKEELLELAKYISIISHANGRIRFRISPKIIQASKDLDVGKLDEFLRNLAGIKDFKVNKLIGSLTINYDPSLIDPTSWEALSEGILSEQFDEQLKNIL